MFENNLNLYSYKQKIESFSPQIHLLGVFDR